jgi:hypothetical protein
VNRTGAHHIIFTTGTDTDVGSTLLIGLLLHRLRQSGRDALAMQPFRSGSRADAEFLHAVQDGELAPDESYLFFSLGTPRSVGCCAQTPALDPFTGGLAAKHARGRPLRVFAHRGHW